MKSQSTTESGQQALRPRHQGDEPLDVYTIDHGEYVNVDSAGWSARLQFLPLSDLDYMVGKRVRNIGLGDEEMERRRYIRDLTAPKTGNAQQRLEDAIRAGIVAKPDEVLVAAFQVFEPRGLWMRLRALDPHDSESDERMMSMFKRRHRSATQALAKLDKVRLSGDTLFRSYPEGSNPKEEKELFERRLQAMRRQLLDAQAYAETGLVAFSTARRGFPEDSERKGLVDRHRLVFVPVIDALRRFNRRFWSYMRLAELIRLSDRHWADDPCPIIGDEYRTTVNDLAGRLRTAMHRFDKRRRVGPARREQSRG